MPPAERSHKAPIEDQNYMFLAQKVSQIYLLAFEIYKRKRRRDTGILIGFHDVHLTSLNNNFLSGATQFHLVAN
jgi:hypothetical protein